ncbi:protein of unknown function [Candidatus Nitrosocosmicus franklandus]|uniref:Uncharacterized protein n=1 Tax=Candidatus Nitrosocosmicus franklandianus TaxID=1798806 RepID=A0A484IDD5_9ARCH|nr:protein of unknown function [Candidatus Nitrosocosmicus franklandus]
MTHNPYPIHLTHNNHTLHLLGILHTNYGRGFSERSEAVINLEIKNIKIQQSNL